jgi:hypothetical protein
MSVDITGKATATQGDAVIELLGEGQTLLIKADSLDTLRSLKPKRSNAEGDAGKKDGVFSLTGSASQAKKLTAMLEKMGLTVKVQVEDEVVATVGAGVETGWLEEKLGFDGVDINKWQLIKSYFKGKD